MRNKIYKNLILFLIFSLISTSLSYALEITPARQEITASPGETVEGTYVVLNDSGSTETVSVSIRDWVISEYNTGISARQWLEISTEGFDIEAGESKPVDFQAEIPSEAEGALFAMITMQTQPSGDEVLSVALSVPVFIIVDGTENYEGELKDLKVDRNNDSLQFSVDVHNMGNVHLRPKGRFIIESDDESIEIDMIEGRPVYPESNRTYMARIDSSEIPPGNYTLKAEVDTGEIKIDTNAQVKMEKNGNAKIIK